MTTTVRMCPNCNRTKGTLYRCVDCGHEGCASDRLFQSMEGCWRSGGCPKCGGTKKAAIVATLGY